MHLNSLEQSADQNANTVNSEREKNHLKLNNNTSNTNSNNFRPESRDVKKPFLFQKIKSTKKDFNKLDIEFKKYEHLKQLNINQFKKTRKNIQKQHDSEERDRRVNLCKFKKTFLNVPQLINSSNRSRACDHSNSTESRSLYIKQNYHNQNNNGYFVNKENVGNNT